MSAPPAAEEPRKRADVASFAAPLGAREREVAKLVARRLTTQEIANALGTSFHTVRTQIARVFDKVGVRTRGGLASVLAATGDAPTPDELA